MGTSLMHTHLSAPPADTDILLPCRVSNRSSPSQHMTQLLTETHHPVFPGGFLPTLTFMVEMLTKGSQGRLVVDAVSNIGPHYARTLREWRRRFEAHFEDTIIPGAYACSAV